MEQATRARCYRTMESENKAKEMVEGLIRSIPLLLKSRGREAFAWVWATAVACLIIGKGTPPLVPSILSLAIAFFLSSAVYIYNDIQDWEMDKSNPVKADRPIPSGKVSRENAEKFVFLWIFFGLSISIFVNLNTFIFSSLYVVLLLLYSYPKIYLKKRTGMKEIIVALQVVMLSLIGSYAVLNYLSINAFFSSFIVAIYSFAAQPALADTTDIEVDKMRNVRSIATITSWKRRMQILFIGILLVMTLTPFTYLYLDFNIILPIFVVLACLVLLRYIFPITNALDKADLLKLWKMGYSFFIIIQILFVIGSLKIPFFLKI